MAPRATNGLAKSGPKTRRVARLHFGLQRQQDVLDGRVSYTAWVGEFDMRPMDGCLIADGCHEARREGDRQELGLSLVPRPDRYPLREEAKIAGASHHAARPLIGDAHFDGARRPQAHRDAMILEAEFRKLAGPESMLL